MDRDRRKLLAVLGAAAAGAGVGSTAAASSAAVSKLGLTKREMERELNWQLRNPPRGRKLADYISKAFVTVLDKNNARIAEQLNDILSAPSDDESF